MTQESIAISETPPLPGLKLVQDANAALATIATDFAGDDDPASLSGPYMTWADTASGLIKRRNDANTAWVIEGYLFRSAVTNLNSDQIPSADQGSIFVAGVGRMSWFNGAYAPNNLQPRHRTGGGISVVSANTVSLTACQVRSLNNECDIILPATITKTLQQGPWTAGDGGSGLFTGVRAGNTWYHVFVMRNDTTGDVDIGFDTSTTAANRPSGWTAYRRMGSVFTDGLNSLRPIGQNGNQFYWLDRISDVTGGSVSTTSGGTSVTISTPRGVSVQAHLSLFLGALTGTDLVVQVFPPSASETSLVGPGARGDIFRSGSNLGFANKSVITGVNSDIRVRGSGNEPTALNIATTGWTDFLGDA